MQKDVVTTKGCMHITPVQKRGGAIACGVRDCVYGFITDDEGRIVDARVSAIECRKDGPQVLINCLNCGDLTFWPDWICAWCYTMFPKELVDALPIRGEWLRRLFDGVKGQGEEGISVGIDGLEDLKPDPKEEASTDIGAQGIPEDIWMEKKDAPDTQVDLQDGIPS